MNRKSPITRESLLDSEGSAIAELIEQARDVMRRVLNRSKVDGLSVAAARSILEHYEAKPSIQANITGPVVLTWGTTSTSPMMLGPSKENSTTPGDGNGHEPASSSVTDDLESL